MGAFCLCWSKLFPVIITSNFSGHYCKQYLWSDNLVIVRLYSVSINSVYLYEDKMVIMVNYKDGEIATTFDEITEILTQKENPDNQKDYQSSPLKAFGDPYGTRTRVAGVKGQSLNRLTNGPYIRNLRPSQRKAQQRGFALDKEV